MAPTPPSHRSVYQPPCAVRLEASSSGKGAIACAAAGTGDVTYCQSDGSSASQSCVTTGYSAGTFCDASGSGAATSCVGDGSTPGSA
jgi:hypothetical protein